ncbi:MAG: hypothetical protein IJL92_03620 [Thermoguttaceae bacterium]|nr:hypothetical protein [Thermoguttaceae bacterium]
MRNQDASLYQRAKKFLMRRTNYETFKSIPYDQMKGSLERVRRFLTYLGNPDRQYAIVHVAGTKGKGTTCAALDQIYRAAGYRVGLFTSPHLEELVERFQINGQNCDKTLFAETTFALADQWKDFLAREKRSQRKNGENGFDESEIQLTFFEWTLIIAVTLFARAKVDVAILEVGLGGRFDATNACDADVSVLTSVSYDHCEQLGNTIRAIASEKLGIVKSNAPLVCGAGYSGSLYRGMEEFRNRFVRLNHESRDETCRRSCFSRRDADESDSIESDAPAYPEFDAPSMVPVAPLFKIGNGVTMADYAFAVDPQTTISAEDVETVRNLARAKAAEFNAPFYSVEALSPRVAAFPTPPFDSVRRWNFEIALRVVETLATRITAPERRPGADDPEHTRRYPVSDAAISVAAANFAIPARFEIVSKTPLIVVDGAHNRASVAAFMREVAERFPDRKVKILLATTIGKDIRGILAELIARADEIILSERQNDPRATPLPDMIQIAETLMDETCSEDSPIRRKFHVAPDFRAFLADYCTRPNKGNDVLCAIGSFYFAAKVRRILKKSV